MELRSTAERSGLLKTDQVAEEGGLYFFWGIFFVDIDASVCYHRYVYIVTELLQVKKVKQ